MDTNHDESYGMADMCACGINPAAEPHSCPNEEELEGYSCDEYCTCCPDCVENCMEQI